MSTALNLAKVVAGGKTPKINNNLTLNGTDGTTFTFPGTSGTVITSSDTGTVTNAMLAGSITMSKLTGTLSVSNGGTGVSTLTGIVKGNGTGAFTAATSGTDYQAPIGTISGLVKGNGANTLTAATAGTDYVAPNVATTFTTPQSFSSSGIKLKGSSTGYTTFFSENTTITDYTLTFPAITGKVIATTSNGTSGQVLTSSGADAPIWTDVPDSGQAFSAF